VINGRMDEGSPIGEVALLLPDRPPLQIEFVIDTGFAGYLTMPPMAISALNLPFFYKMPANLANDSNVVVDVHTTVINWHGERREVEVMAIGRRPLIGRSLLKENEVCITFADDGRISIRQVHSASG